MSAPEHPTVELVRFHIWHPDGKRYTCTRCLLVLDQPVTFGCPGRQGRPAPEDRTKERA